MEVAGTSGAANDGFYYDDSSDPADGVTQYTGYDEANGELTRFVCVYISVHVQGWVGVGVGVGLEGVACPCG